MSDADVRCPRCQRFMPMETCDVCTIDDAIVAVANDVPLFANLPTVAEVMRELKGRASPQQVAARLLDWSERHDRR